MIYERFGTPVAIKAAEEVQPGLWAIYAAYDGKSPEDLRYCESNYLRADDGFAEISKVCANVTLKTPISQRVKLRDEYAATTARVAAREEEEE